MEQARPAELGGAPDPFQAGAGCAGIDAISANLTFAEGCKTHLWKPLGAETNMLGQAKLC